MKRRFKKKLSQQYQTQGVALKKLRTLKENKPGFQMKKSMVDRKEKQKRRMIKSRAKSAK